MAIIGVTDYTNTYATSRTNGSNGVSRSTQEYLNELKEKYPDVNITVTDFNSEKQSDAYMLGTRGYNNIAVRRKGGRIMKFRDYCADKIILILLNIGGMLVLSEYLSMVGNVASTIILIDILWFIILCSWFLIGWYTRNRYFIELRKRVSALKQP